MNQYGVLAREHWTKYAPSRVAQMENAQEFFEGLGEQVATQVTTLSRQLEAQSPPEAEYLNQVGRLTAIRKQAEEVALSDLVWLPADQVEYSELEAAEIELGELPDRLYLQAEIRDLLADQQEPEPQLFPQEAEARLANLRGLLARVVELERLTADS